MWTWTLSISAFFFGTYFLLSDNGTLAKLLNIRREAITLNRVVFLLQELEETLAAGAPPSPTRWDALRALPAPWGKLSYESVQQIRDSGGALLPTLKRIRALATEHQASLKEARAKSSQALAQSLVCAAMVPIFGATLYFLLPGVEERHWTWLIACTLAAAFSCAAALWLLSMAEAARWGGLKTHQRVWALAALCAIEKFMASVRAGLPADLAWVRTSEFLLGEAPELASRWGASVWHDDDATSEEMLLSHSSISITAATALVGTGATIRKAVAVSLMEGKPCLERVENALLGLKLDLKSCAEREISLLGARALKPLFICIAPALMGLLAFSLYLSWLAVA